MNRALFLNAILSRRLNIFIELSSARFIFILCSYRGKIETRVQHYGLQNTKCRNMI